MFKVEDVSFSYDGKRNVLDGVSFSIDKGDILCLLGSNGTGKTTLIRCILGFQKPSGGAIVIDGQNLEKLSHKKRASYIAYVPQSSNLAFPYTVVETVLMGRVSHIATGASYSAHDKEVVYNALERLQITKLADRRYQELSGGEKQMVLVARALAQEAELLVMDEPTSNLDFHNQVKILAAIKHLAGKGLGILMTSHYPDHAFLACSKVALMKNGKVTACGNPKEVITSESLTNLYNTPVAVANVTVHDLKVRACIPLLDDKDIRLAGFDPNSFNSGNAESDTLKTTTHQPSNTQQKQ